MKRTLAFVVIGLVLFSLACATSPDRITVQNPGEITPTPSITPETEFSLGMLNTRGQTTLRIPLNKFAKSESELNGASLDIYVEQEKYLQELGVTDYYHENGEVITFMIPGLASLSNLSKFLDISNGFAPGTKLGFALHTSAGETNYYQGKVSATESTIATSAQSIDVLPPETE